MKMESIKVTKGYASPTQYFFFAFLLDSSGGQFEFINHPVMHKLDTARYICTIRQHNIVDNVFTLPSMHTQKTPNKWKRKYFKIDKA